MSMQKQPLTKMIVLYLRRTMSGLPGRDETFNREETKHLTGI